MIVAADPAIESLDDAAGRTLAINEPESWSGHLALVRHLTSTGRDLSMFGSTIRTGSHQASVAAVANGDADLASIDHTVWEYLDPLGSIRVVDRTRDWPAPPFALDRGLDPGVRERLGAALFATRDTAGLAALAPADRRDYEVMHPTPP